MMIINGENIFPGDIEDYGAGAPGVRECVVMVDDDRFYLFVARAAELDLHALSHGITRRFGAKPAGIALGARNDILRTTAGKPMRQAMLKRLRDQHALE
jgi:acyl-CoA synthetase (AMP-forming)/AMP-acid ligase II